MGYGSAVKICNAVDTGVKKRTVMIRAPYIDTILLFTPEVDTVTTHAQITRNSVALITLQHTES